MIIDTLANLHTYKPLHPLLGQVVAFIAKEDLGALKKGRIELTDGIYANVDEYETTALEDTFIECHKRYIDIQIIMAGVERIGICHTEEAKSSALYNEAGDFEKLDGKCDFLTLKKGYFVLFYPWDGHAPGLKIDSVPERVKKIVFKIPVTGGMTAPLRI
ncbi:MAG: YhcH/YjgK/YiaL family protein [Deltaproteobacteria bacterium]|nr:YhcH/YjgK/YiaL family protein [Deltaproteobacteria bacterium]